MRRDEAYQIVDFVFCILRNNIFKVASTTDATLVTNFTSSADMRTISQKNVVFFLSLINNIIERNTGVELLLSELKSFPQLCLKNKHL